MPLLHRKWMECRDKQKAGQQPELPLVRVKPVSPRPSTWVRNNGPATPHWELDSRDPRYQGWNYGGKVHSRHMPAISMFYDLMQRL